MNILLCGDVMGRAGRAAVKAHLPQLKRDLAIDVAIVNAENAAHGYGLSEKLAGELYEAGADILTTGNHAHVPTADPQILPGGTAYLSDAGMCGDYDSVIGMEKGPAVRRFLTRMPSEKKASPADGEATLCGVFVVTDDATGLAARIESVRVGGRLAPCMPALRP